MKKVLLDISKDNLEMIKKASEKEMRSQRNFILSCAVQKAKELIGE